jgi:hypothetical protein
VELTISASLPGPISSAYPNVRIAYSTNILAQFPLVPMEQPLVSS